MSKLHQLTAALEQRLHHFAGTIDLREECYGCDVPNSNPYFPKLYLSDKKDKALMNMPGEGTALINYKVQRRNIDETRPADDEAGESAAELSNARFLHQFAGTRDRDPEGRFDSGTVAKADDFALANMSGKKKAAIGAGVGVAAGAAGLAGTQAGRSMSRGAYAAWLLRKATKAG